jgi:hypothetical protein
MIGGIDRWPTPISPRNPRIRCIARTTFETFGAYSINFTLTSAGRRNSIEHREATERVNKAIKPAIMLVSVALIAALIGHVLIDVLGDFVLDHDAYDDIDHSSRGIVALITLALAALGIGLGLRATIRDACGSEYALCASLRRAIPRSGLTFSLRAIALATLALCAMEAVDAALAGHPVDDLGDLFGGSIVFGGSIIGLVAAIVSQTALAALRRCAHLRLIASAVVAFLRRSANCIRARVADFDVVHELIYHAFHLCRRIAGRAPPLLSPQRPTSFSAAEQERYALSSIARRIGPACRSRATGSTVDDRPVRGDRSNLRARHHARRVPHHRQHRRCARRGATRLPADASPTAPHRRSPRPRTLALRRRSE